MKAQAATESQEIGKSPDIPIGVNQAYETVDPQAPAGVDIKVYEALDAQTPDALTLDTHSPISMQSSIVKLMMKMPDYFPESLAPVWQ